MEPRPLQPPAISADEDSMSLVVSSDPSDQMERNLHSVTVALNGSLEQTSSDPTSGSRAAVTITLRPVDKKTFPVIEIFGVTIQGEGRWIGSPTHFVRFGGCDYRCDFCDSMYAVLPEEVRKNSTSLNANQILQRLEGLPGDPGKVVLSGGNPALLNLELLIDALHDNDYEVSVETQGSRWKPWFEKLDLLTLSPKPPSSGMVTDWEVLDYIVAIHPGQMDIKIVAFDNSDLEYAKYAFDRYPATHDGRVRHFLSLGTFVGTSSRDDLLDRMRWLVETATHDSVLARVTCLPQLHVLVWGHGRGF